MSGALKLCFAEGGVLSYFRKEAWGGPHLPVGCLAPILYNEEES